jgi:hypothetical protein
MDYSSLLCGKLTMFTFCNYEIVLAKVSCVILRLFWLILLFVVLVEILGLWVLIFVYALFWLFMISLGTWVGTWVLVCYGHEWAHECRSSKGMCESWWLLNPFFAGTLTHVKTIEMFVERAFCHRMHVIRGKGLLLFVWARTYRSCVQVIKSP